MPESPLLAPVEPQKFPLGISACEHGPQIDVTELLKIFKKTRVVMGERSYILRLTPRGGLQLCAED